MSGLRALLAAAALGSAVPAGAAWQVAETPALVGVSRGSAADLAERLGTLQDFDALLRLVTGTAPLASTARLPVYFLSDLDFRRLGARESGFIGFYTSGPGLTAAFISADRARAAGADTQTTLFHEYTHHFMFAAGRAAYPAWYVEGLAEYLSTARIAGGEARVGDASRGRAFTLLRRPWLPLRRVMTARVRDLNGDEISPFYAQGWLLVHYLARDDTRRAQLTAYLSDPNRARDPDAAFKAAFGVDYSGMERALRSYMRGREMNTTVLGVEFARGAVTPLPSLPASADALLIPSLRLARMPFARTPPPGEAATATAARAARDAELLASVRDAAAKYPGDAFAEAVLIEAEIKLGDSAAGMAKLDAAVAARPDDAGLLSLQGRALVAVATAEKRAGGDATETFRRARVALTQANRLRPDDYRILAAHAHTYPLASMPPREVDVLLRAADLAPQVPSLASFAARAVLANRGDKTLAKALLGPVANNPHGGAQAAAAAKLIDAIDAGTPLARDLDTED